MKFSASKLKARFKKRLNEIGFDSSADVNKLLERFKTSQIAPDELESILEDLETQNDDTLLSDLTQAIGLSRVPPSPRRNLKSLFESTTEIGRIVENAHLPKNEYAQLKSFSEDCLAAGAQMSDIRSYLTDFDSVDVQEITEHMANNYGVSPIPVFHLDEAHVLAQVKAQLINANLVFDAATTTTLKSLTTQVPYDEMKDFINALKYQHQIPGQFSKFAKKHGVAASALKPDLPSSHAHLKSYAKKALIGYNASFSKVVEKLLLNGTTVGSVENLLDALTKDPDLKAALSKAKIDLPSGTRLPKVDYDDDATAAFAFAKMPTAMQQMVSSSRFEKAIAKCLRAGLSPKESTDFMKRYYKDGRASAVKKSGVADGKLPDFPVDANAVAREFKKRFGKSAFTTAHSKYVREAFPKALGDGAFQPDAWVQTLPTILAKLEASSGIKAP